MTKNEKSTVTINTSTLYIESYALAKKNLTHNFLLTPLPFLLLFHILSSRLPRRAHTHAVRPSAVQRCGGKQVFQGELTLA